MPKKGYANAKKKDPVRLTPQEDRRMKFMARWFEDHQIAWRRFVGKERAARLGIDLNAKPSRQSLWIIGLELVAAEVKAFRTPVG